MHNARPIVVGHEIVGDVVAVGEGVSRVAVGARVGGPWHGGHDQTCRPCQRSQFQMCDNQAINGVTRDGGYAEYVLLRAEAVVRVPASLDPAETAPLLCAGVTVFNSLRRLHVEQGGLVAVEGLGGLGHLAVQYASRMGYRVAVLSRGGDGDKRGFALELGASDFVDTSSNDGTAELQALGGADVIVATAPNPAAISPLVAGLAKYGRLLVLAPAGPIAVNTGLLVSRGISVHGWPSGHAIDLEEAIAFAERHGVRCLVERFPLEKSQEAVEYMLAGKPRFRAVLTM